MLGTEANNTMIKIRKNKIKHGIGRSKIKDNITFFIMLIPAIIVYILFSYMPMFGTLIAFKDYRYADGIFGSDWVGLKNFESFFSSSDAFLTIRNTVLYGVAFIIADVVFGIIIGILVYEVSRRIFTKYYQTTMLLPHFMSWVVVAYVVYAFLDPVNGVINRAFGVDINWYSDPKWWPFFIMIAHVWKGVGMNSIMYYSALMGIDETLYEAASIDGANKWQQTLHITIPELRSIVSILIILGMGKVFKGDFGLFYQIPMDVGALYPVTDIIDTYVFRGLRSGDIGVNTAVCLVQSVVGLVMVLASNAVVRKIDPDSSMF